MPASAAPLPIEETTIAALHAAYVSGRSTAVSVCQAHLDRIAAYDRKGPALGAIIVNNPDALSDAAALDAALESTGKLVGPLAESATVASPQGNGEIKGYLVRPASSAKLPVVLVVHQNRGLNPHVATGLTRRITGWRGDRCGRGIPPGRAGAGK